MTLEKKCGFCNLPLEGEACQFATCKKSINGKEYVFCCESCSSKFTKSQ